MKVFLTAAFVSFFLILLTGPLKVYGQETSNSSSPSPKPIRVEKKVEKIEERVVNREQQLKERLTKIRDKKKVAIIERSNTYLKRINLQKTQQTQKSLDRMSDILTRLKKRVEEKGAGKDITEAQKAINEAEAKIKSAKDLVTAQAAKEYTPTISDETKMKEEMKTIQETIRADMETLKKSVTEAKQALQRAIEVSAKTFGQK